MIKAMSAMNKQSGAALLVSVVLLFVLVGLVTVYTGRVKSLEHRVMLNEVNHTQAFAAAEAGLNVAFATLRVDPDWNGAAINQNLANGTQFSVTGARQTVTRLSNEFDLITLSSVGTSDDGLSTETITEQGIQYSVLANPPDAPLIVAGGLDVSGNFEVAANPNGGGPGVPISIWSDGDVDLNNGSGTTCGLQEFQDGNCSSSPYSENGFQDLDIVDNDPTFPDDLLQYMFNVPEDEWEALRADADLRITDCDVLGPASTGLIWMDGDCSVNSNTIIGSTAEPVILIVTDGDLTMNGGAQINGILFSFRKPGVVADFELNMIGGARVNGVVASNHPVGHANGTYNSVFDADVLAQIEQNDAFQRIARVPGSWRDF